MGNIRDFIVIVLLSISLGYAINELRHMYTYDLIEESTAPGITLSPSSFTTEVIGVGGFTLHLMNSTELNRVYHEVYNGSAKEVVGFTLTRQRDIFTDMSSQIDINNKTIPNLCTLGHEVYHLPELGDYWHEQAS